MIRALTLLFGCQLIGETIVRAAGLPFPGPVLGMGLLFAGLLAVGRTGSDLDGVAFFTMELIDGVSFVDYVRGRTARGQLPNLVRLGRALAQIGRAHV